MVTPASRRMVQGSTKPPVDQLLGVRRQLTNWKAANLGRL